MKSFLMWSSFILCTLSLSAQWRQCQGPFAGIITDYAHYGSDLYALTVGDRIYKSTDYGKTWSPMTYKFEGHPARCMIIRENLFLVGTDGGLFKSTDNGQTWKKKALSTQLLSVTCMAFKENSIFACAKDSGVFVSSDQGETWSSKSNGIKNMYINDIHLKGDSLFVGTNESGLFVSGTNGENWVKIGNGLGVNTSVSKITSHGNYLYSIAKGKSYYSKDNGINWTLIGISNVTSNIFYVDETGVFLGTNRGVFYTPHIGQTLQTRNKDIDTRSVQAITRINGKLIIGTLYSGNYVSDDNGLNWKSSNSGLLNNAVLSMSNSSSGLFVNTGDSGVSVTYDLGNTWITRQGMSQGFICNILGTGNKTLIGGEGAAIYLSTDQGETWNPLRNNLPDLTVWSIATDSSSIYIGTNGRGIYRLENNSNAWTSANTGLNLVSTHYVSTLVMNGNFLYAGTHYGAFYSKDKGKHWLEGNTDMKFRVVKSILPFNDWVYISTFDSGIYLTKDTFKSWSKLPISTRQIKYYDLLKWNNSIFLATSEGIFLSKDSGKLWEPINSGLGNLVVRKLAVKDGYLFAGTESDGVWRRLLAEMVGLRNSTKEPEITIYPNPSQDIFNIFSLMPIKSIVAYNLQGQEIICKDSGSFIDLSGYESGIYFIRIFLENAVVTRKISLGY